jgi:hypothetical protein
MSTLKKEAEYDAKSSFQNYKKWQQRRQDITEKMKEKLKDSPTLTLNKPEGSSPQKQETNTSKYVRNPSALRQQIIEFSTNIKGKQTKNQNYSRQQNTLTTTTNLQDYTTLHKVSTKEKADIKKTDENKKNRFDDILNSYFSPLVRKSEPKKEDDRQLNNKGNKANAETKKTLLTLSPETKISPKKAAKSPILNFKEIYQAGDFRFESKKPTDLHLNGRATQQDAYRTTTPMRDYDLPFKSRLGSIPESNKETIPQTARVITTTQ